MCYKMKSAKYVVVNVIVIVAETFILNELMFQY